jgi:hypothetical protein
MYEDINLKGDKKTILFEICKKIKVCYILLEILKCISRKCCVQHVYHALACRAPFIFYINLKGDKKTILFEICKKIKVCYILLEILKYIKK